METSECQHDWKEFETLPDHRAFRVCPHCRVIEWLDEIVEEQFCDSWETYKMIKARWQTR